MFNNKFLYLSIFSILILPVSNLSAQSSENEEVAEEVVVTGIRSALASANAQKRNSDNLVEVIVSEDIGKLPDQNLAEVLENITGVKITRTAGVGTGVQIRGTNSNRVEINGVSTVGAGSSRNGISFEDINASIISSLEVIKTLLTSVCEETCWEEVVPTENSRLPVALTTVPSPLSAKL